MELHGGQIFAVGEEGIGATFTVSLLKGKSHFDLERVTIVETEESISSLEDREGQSKSSEQNVVKSVSTEMDSASSDVTQVVQLSAEVELRFVELEDASGVVSLREMPMKINA